MTARLVVALLVLLAALPARADVPSGEAQAVVKGQLKDILPAGRTVRDYAVFETERGEGALLVLSTTDPPPETTVAPLQTCAESDAGGSVVGIFSVALVVRGVLVNEVGIPGDDADFVPRALALPERSPLSPSPTTDEDPNVVQSTRLLRLADYDGDGNEFEFRLLRPDGCRHDLTLLAGYSPRRRQVVVFPVVDGGTTSFWARDAFPPPSDAGSPRLTTHTACGRTKLRFDPRRELWRVVGVRRAPCGS